MPFYIFCILYVLYILTGFPGGSDGQASACNAGNPGSIPSSIGGSFDSGFDTFLSFFCDSFIGVCACVCACTLCPVRLFVTSWTVARQAPLWKFPGKHTGVGCHFLLQGILPTQESTQVSCVSCFGWWVLY